MFFNIYITGKDATEAFEDVGHSDEARGLLPGLLVGELDEASVSIQSNPPEQENSSQKDDNVLLEVRINIGPSLRHCSNDDGNRRSCNRVVHQRHYSTTMT